MKRISWLSLLVVLVSACGGEVTVADGGAGGEGGTGGSVITTTSASSAAGGAGGAALDAETFCPPFCKDLNDAQPTAYCSFVASCDKNCVNQYNDAVAKGCLTEFLDTAACIYTEVTTDPPGGCLSTCSAEKLQYDKCTSK